MKVTPMDDENNTLNNSGETNPQSWIRTRLLPVLSIFFVIGIVVLIYMVFVKDPARFEMLQKYVYLGAFLISLIGNASVIFPLAVLGGLTAIASTLLPTTGVIGPILIGLAGGAGAGLGEITGYLAGYGGHVVLQKVKYYPRVEGWMGRHGGVTIFLMSLFPFVFDVVGLAAGSLRYPFGKFLLYCWLGRTLNYMTWVTLGSMGIARIFH
jgi:membrane protein DedA with SNARE-associated domain